MYNTGAFDSIAHLFAAICTLKKNILQALKTGNDLFANLIISMALNRPDIYEIRDNLLNLHFKSEANASIINCECNVTYIIDKYLTSSYCKIICAKSCTNITCSVNHANIITRSTGFVPINIQLILESGPQVLEDSALECMIKMFECKEKSCGGYNYLLRVSIFTVYCNRTQL